jgi:hypothetical protein
VSFLPQHDPDPEQPSSASALRKGDPIRHGLGRHNNPGRPLGAAEMPQLADATAPLHVELGPYAERSFSAFPASLRHTSSSRSTCVQFKGTKKLRPTADVIGKGIEQGMPTLLEILLHLDLEGSAHERPQLVGQPQAIGAELAADPGVSPAQMGYLLEGIDWRVPQQTWRPELAADWVVPSAR